MTATNKVAFKVFRGKTKDMPEQRHDGYIYFTTDEEKFYKNLFNKYSFF